MVQIKKMLMYTAVPIGTISIRTITLLYLNISVFSSSSVSSDYTHQYSLIGKIIDIGIDIADRFS